jgi:hypothetical protein
LQQEWARLILSTYNRVGKYTREMQLTVEDGLAEAKVAAADAIAAADAVGQVRDCKACSAIEGGDLP